MTDVFTFGEAMLRLSTPPGDTLETAPAFDIHVAGAEANVASSLARLGRSVSFMTALPESSLGRRVLSELQASGVDCSGIVMRPGSRLGTYFVELRSEPLPARVIYDRAGSAAAQLDPADVPWQVFDQASIVHVSGITPALSTSCREMTLEVARRARDEGKLLSVDVNYRSKLWSKQEAADTIRELISGAGIVVCTREDCLDVFGIDRRPAEAAAELADLFDIRRVVVTSGAEGSWWHMNGSTGGRIPAIEVDVIDRIGAGDAFMAGVLDGLLDEDLEVGINRGTALAALALTTKGDRPVATREEVNAILSGTGRRVDR